MNKPEIVVSRQEGPVRDLKNGLEVKLHQHVHSHVDALKKKTKNEIKKFLSTIT